MKYFNFLLFILIISACSSKEEFPTCLDAKYDQEFTVRIGETVCFEDGNSFEVKTITDQFCCCDCHCFLPGYLEVMVETTNQQGLKDLFTFSSITTQTIGNIFEGHLISDFHYVYDDEPDSLPLCEGGYDASEVELIMKISS